MTDLTDKLTETSAYLFPKAAQCVMEAAAKEIVRLRAENTRMHAAVATSYNVRHYGCGEGICRVCGAEDYLQSIADGAGAALSSVVDKSTGFDNQDGQSTEVQP